MDAVNSVVEGVKNATIGENPKKQQGQKKEKKDKKKGGEGSEDGRPLKVIRSNSSDNCSRLT
jgi:hypothetical protein